MPLPRSSGGTRNELPIRHPEGSIVSAFLDADDLKTLTGYKRAAEQIQWLEEHGVPHFVNSKRKPVVRRDMDQAVTEPELGEVR